MESELYLLRALPKMVRKLDEVKIITAINRKSTVQSCFNPLALYGSYASVDLVTK